MNIHSAGPWILHPFWPGIDIHIASESLFTSLRNDYSHAPESARCLCLFADSPCFHPHSGELAQQLDACSGSVSAGAAISQSTWYRSSGAAQSPDSANLLVALLLRILVRPPIATDERCGGVHILHPLPTACAAGQPVYARQPRSLVSCRSFLRVQPA